MERYTPLAPGGPSLGLKEDILFLEIAYFYIFDGAAKLRWAGGGPVWRANGPIKTGARSVRERTRGQNPLVLLFIYLGSSVCHIPVVLSSCHPVCRSCGTLSYSLSIIYSSRILCLSSCLSSCHPVILSSFHPVIVAER